MLELRRIRKSYTTGDFTQVALNDVSITFRPNEFVAVLGTSGSGKTTMLNIVGGLDQYDSGDLIIDGVSTKEYKDRDWDAYRNNRVGFVFQSYNLIPHQSVLSNVEIALTLAGVSKAERRERALEALKDVGLEDHVHKRPNQLSGGQMQRVAIARALINDPEILLADEPTGALDTTTSVQIMDLLTEIAKTRLVVMVTHNPELAEQYATRIVQLRDGEIIEDSDPYTSPSRAAEDDEDTVRRTSMGFLTAISLSFNNLMTKKGRTLMTSFAGSIGIIGIAAILALANGVNNYIKSVEQDTLSQYPLSIQAQSFDMTAMFDTSTELMKSAGDKEAGGEVREVPAMANMFSSIGTNDLTSLKRFLDAGGNGIDEYVSNIDYAYDITPHVYIPDYKGKPRQVNPDSSLAMLGFTPPAGAAGFTAGMQTSAFRELDADLTLTQESYDVMAGRWPQSSDEAIVLLSIGGGISDLALYGMGLKDPADLDAMTETMMAGDEVKETPPVQQFTYKDVLGVELSVVNPADYYVHDESFDVWVDKRNDEAHVQRLVDGAHPLKVVGVAKPNENVGHPMPPGLYYTRDLTLQLMSEAAGKEVVQKQLEKPEVNVFTGQPFSDSEDTAQDIDMSELFSIDEKAIASAFQFDASKLQPDMRNLDLDLDMSKIKIDPSKLPPLDLRELVKDFDPDTLIKDLLRELDKLPEPRSPFGDLPDLDFESFLKYAPELIDTYVTWSIKNGHDPADLEKTLPLFFASDEGKEALNKAADELNLDPKYVEEQVTAYLKWVRDKNLDPNDHLNNIRKYLEEKQREALEEYINEYLSKLNFDELREKMGKQLQDELQAYMEATMRIIMADVGKQMGETIASQMGPAMQKLMGNMGKNMKDAMNVNPEAFMAAFEMKKSKDDLTQLFMSMATTRSASYESNLRTLGYAAPESPSIINIYPLDFESKAKVIDKLDAYNAEQTKKGDEDKVITYSDFVGALMSSVTDIINTISYVLIAFVAISLVVSSIMIGVITYISVLERRKEIGILRAVGASKRDIRRVFNAETLIVGFVAGLLGVLITALLTIPANAIVYSKFDVPNVAVLPVQAAVILVIISMVLTSIAGLMPSSSASRKDPVEALRSE